MCLKVVSLLIFSETSPLWLLPAFRQNYWRRYFLIYYSRYIKSVSFGWCFLHLEAEGMIALHLEALAEASSDPEAFVQGIESYGCRDILSFTRLAVNHRAKAYPSYPGLPHITQQVLARYKPKKNNPRNLTRVFLVLPTGELIRSFLQISVPVLLG
jgi:hypothetical protein